MCRFNSFSPGQKAIHVGITWGFMKTPGFRPPLSYQIAAIRHILDDFGILLRTQQTRGCDNESSLWYIDRGVCESWPEVQVEESAKKGMTNAITNRTINTNNHQPPKAI
jgi:hypothetical protein